MTENITSTENASTSEKHAKALLARLAVEAKYRSPNGGYVSNFNQCVPRSNSERQQVRVSASELQEVSYPQPVVSVELIS